MQTDATSQLPTLLDVITCCVRLYTLMHVVECLTCCCAKFEAGQTCSYVQTDATTPNNVGSCWLTVLHPFAHGLIATSYLEIVSKLAHLLGPLEQKTNRCRRDHHKIMTSLPKYGVLLAPKYGQKCKFFRVTQNLGVFDTLRGIMNLPPRQPRFLARLPRWQ